MILCQRKWTQREGEKKKESEGKREKKNQGPAGHWYILGCDWICVMPQMCLAQLRFEFP